MHQESILRSLKSRLSRTLHRPDTSAHVARIVASLDMLVLQCESALVRLKIYEWKVRLAESIETGTSRGCVVEIIVDVVQHMQPTSVDQYLTTVLDVRYDRQTDWDSLVRAVSEVSELAIDPPWADPDVPVMFSTFDSDPTKSIYLIGYSHPYVSSDWIHFVSPSSCVHVFKLRTMSGWTVFICMGPSADASAAVSSLVREILCRID